MLLMLLINKDINLWPTQKVPKWMSNQTWTLKSSQINLTEPLPSKIPVLVWPNKKWSTISELSLNPEPKLSWKLSLPELIFLWLDNLVSVSTLLISSPLKSKSNLDLTTVMFNTDGNPLLEVLSPSLKTKKTPIKSKEEPKSSWPWKLITLNSLKKEELKT